MRAYLRVPSFSTNLEEFNSLRKGEWHARAPCSFLTNLKEFDALGAAYAFSDMQMHKGITAWRLKLAIGPFAAYRAYRDVLRSYRDERGLMRCAGLNAMRQERLFPIYPRYIISPGDIIYVCNTEYVIPCNRELASRDYAGRTKHARKYRWTR